MGGHKKRDEAKTVEEPAEARRDVQEGVQESREASGEVPGAPPPRKRGRPPGSKTRGKAAQLPPLPPELAAAMSAMPLLLTSQIVEYATSEPGRPGIALRYAPESLAAVAVAFKAWLESLDLDIGPGTALMLAYAMALASAAPAAMGELAARSEKPAPASAAEKGASS